MSSPPLSGSRRLGFDWPYLIAAWRGMLSPKTLLRDVLAGIVVAFVALPLSLAFAGAAGVDPQVGLVVAIAGGLVAGFLGGSEFSVAGPAAVLGVLLVGISTHHGPVGLLVACLLCGLLQVACGLLRLGQVARYIPLPVVSGFTSGLALLVVMNQLPTLLGVRRLVDIYEVEAIYLWQHFGEADWEDLVVGGTSLLVMLLAPRQGRIPGALLALVAGCLMAAVLPLLWPDVDIDVLEPLRLQIQFPALRSIGLKELGELVLAALGLFFLTTLQSMLCALSCDSQTGTQHHSDQELLGLGLANVVTALVGGIPVTGVFARSAAGIRSGAATRLTAIVQALVLLLLAVVLGEFASLVPLAALAGILVVTGLRMFQWEAIRRTLRASRSEGAILLATLGCIAVTTNMIVGVMVGMGIALVVVAWKAARELARLSSFELVGSGNGVVAIHRLRGPFFFGAAPEFSGSLDRLQEHGVLILDLAQAWSLDTTACEAIVQTARALRRRGATLMLSGLGDKRGLLERYGALAEVGEENVFADAETAQARAEGR